MVQLKPILVLIGGPTCSGKTTVAGAVRDRIGRHACTVIELDRYYRDLSHLPPTVRAAANFDHPDAIDWALLKEHVRSLCSGESVAAPTYDFANHTRRAETVEIGSTPVLLVEGVLALCDEELASAASLRIYIDAPDALCLGRRIARDVTERGRSERSVREQFARTVRPMAEEFVKPMKLRCELVLDGSARIDDLAQCVVDRIPAAYRNR